jgi:hypothetical protein
MNTVQSKLVRVVSRKALCAIYGIAACIFTTAIPQAINIVCRAAEMELSDMNRITRLCAMVTAARRESGHMQRCLAVDTGSVLPLVDLR